MADFRITEHRAADLAEVPGTIWDVTDWRHARMIFWERDYNHKRQAFVLALRQSDTAWIAWQNRRPIACSWLALTSLHAKCASIHFMFCRNTPHALAIGRELLSRVNCLALLALLPRQWRQARTFAQNLGFKQLATLPHACWLDCLKKSSTGYLYLWKKEEIFSF